MVSHRKAGNLFEREFCRLLADKGFWAHNLAQNSAGQPFDILAARNGKCYAIDCKVCEHDIFKLSRIEENQALAMTLWRKTGNGEGWFALQMSDKSIVMFSFQALEDLAVSHAILGWGDMVFYGTSFNEWAEFV